jgi:hypothetical protein
VQCLSVADTTAPAGSGIVSSLPPQLHRRYVAPNAALIQGNNQVTLTRGSPAAQIFAEACPKGLLTHAQLGRDIPLSRLKAGHDAHQLAVALIESDGRSGHVPLRFFRPNEFLA